MPLGFGQGFQTGGNMLAQRRNPDAGGAAGVMRRRGIRRGPLPGGNVDQAMGIPPATNAPIPGANVPGSAGPYGGIMGGRGVKKTGGFGRGLEKRTAQPIAPAAPPPPPGNVPGSADFQPGGNMLADRLAGAWGRGQPAQTGLWNPPPPGGAGTTELAAPGPGPAGVGAIQADPRRFKGAQGGWGRVFGLGG